MMGLGEFDRKRFFIIAETAEKNFLFIVGQGLCKGDDS